MNISILLDEFCEYSISFKGFSKDTIRRYRYVVTCFCRFMQLEKIEQINEQKVRELFYYGRSERQWSVNTYLVYRKSLIVFFRWCLKQGYMKENPAIGIDIPRKPQRIPKQLPDQMALKLLEVTYNYPYEYAFLRYRNHAIFATLIYAGLRKQELLNLKLTDIDLDNLTLFVRQGKGGKDRIVPICLSLARSLRAYLAERKKLNKTHPEFFSSYRLNRGLTNQGLRKLIEQIRDASGISFSAHVLRHTFATLMLEGGCDIYNLSKMMGHENIQTTTIYLSASAKLLRNEIMKHPLNTSSFDL